MTLFKKSKPQAGELVSVWRQKLDAAFANAKKLEKETLSTDKEFSDRLADLRKQYKSA